MSFVRPKPTDPYAELVDDPDVDIINSRLKRRGPSRSSPLIVLRIGEPYPETEKEGKAQGHEGEIPGHVYILGGGWGEEVFEEGGAGE